MRVIVFVLRGCPAGWLGAYGNEWVGTPNLDRLAAEGVVFDRHVSDRPDPDAARAAWRPATLPVHRVLVRANHPDTDGPPEYYASYDEVFDARPQSDDGSPLDELVRTLPSLLDRLAEVPRWAVWVETDRLLPPWDVQQDVFEAYVSEDGEPEPPGEDEEPVTPFADPPTGPFDKDDRAAWEWLHATFATVVTVLDAELGRVFEELRERGLDQTAAWVVTSDLGYPLGEHGQVGLHRPWLHEELVHLPLILRLPGAAEAGRHVSAFTQPTDLAPTLCELLSVAPASDGDGRSLLPLARGQPGVVRACACTVLTVNGATERAIRTDAWALLLPGPLPPDDPPRNPMLFAKPDDRWEVNDLYARNVERADELEAKLREAIPGS